VISRRSLLAAAPLALSACRRETATAPRPSGFCFIANAEGRNLTVVDLAVFNVAKRIALEADAAHVVAHPSRPAAYAVSPGDGLLTEVSARTFQVTRKTEVGVGAARIEWAHDRKSLWVQTARALVQVEPESGKVARRLDLPAPPLDLDFSPETPEAVASFAATNEIALLDLTAGRIARVRKQGAVGAVRILKNQTLAAEPNERLLNILDSASGQTVVELPLAIRPDRLCFSADRGQLFVNGEGSDSVVVIYPYQTQVAATLLAGRKPGAMAASAFPPYLFVANPLSNSVTVIDVLTQRVIGAVPVGEQPSHIAFTRDQRFALVLNRASGDLSVLWTQAFSKIVRRDRTGPMFLMVPVGTAPVSAAVTA
jgi:YVTN family beta-propeller protein